MSISTTIKSIQDIMRKDVGVDGDAQRIGQLVWMLFLKIFDDRETEVRAARRRLPARPSPSRCAGATGPPTPEGMTGDELLDFVNNELFPTLKNLHAGARRPARLRRPQRLRGRLQLHEVRHADAPGHQQDQRRHRLQQRAATATCSATSTSRSCATCRAPATPASSTRPRAVTQFMVDTVNPQAGRNRPRPRLRHRRLPHLRHRTHPQAVRQDRRGRSRRCRQCIRGVEKKPLPHLLCTTNMILHGIDVPSQHPPRQHPAPARCATTARRTASTSSSPTRPSAAWKKTASRTTSPPTFRTRETADLFLVLIMHLLKDGGRAARGAARRHPVRRRHQDPHQGTAAGRVQPAHHRPPAQRRVQPLHRHQDQSAVLHQGRRRPRTSGTTSTPTRRA